MREKLKAFIEAVQREAETGRLRHHFVVSGAGGKPSVWFGYGYFDHKGCLVWPDGGRGNGEIPQEATVEEALNALFPETQPS